MERENISPNKCVTKNIEFATSPVVCYRWNMQAQYMVHKSIDHYHLKRSLWFLQMLGDDDDDKWLEN